MLPISETLTKTQEVLILRSDAKSCITAHTRGSIKLRFVTTLPHEEWIWNVLSEAQLSIQYF
jgi:hypothetical protein